MLIFYLVWSHPKGKTGTKDKSIFFCEGRLRELSGEMLKSTLKEFKIFVSSWRLNKK